MDKSLWRLALTSVFISMLSDRSLSAETCEPWVAKLVSVQGIVEARRAGSTRWTQAHFKGVFCAGDSIRVAQRGRAALRLKNETVLRLDQGTALTLSRIEEKERSWIDLIKGFVHFISRVPRTLDIKTPFVNGATEGTEFAVRSDSEKTDIWVFEGRVVASNDSGRLVLEAGEAGSASSGQAPSRRIPVRLKDAVQWALYYPPLIDPLPAAESGQNLRLALHKYRRGDLPAAFAILDRIDPAERDANFFVLRAGLLLSVGRVKAALADIENALDSAPANGSALALESIIALVQNDQAEAMRQARLAVDLAPTAPAPLIALSYAQQAEFNTEGALQSAEAAVRKAPDNALAWMRVAELRLANGELEQALAAAKEAVELEPTLAGTQTILGFANIIRIDIVQARAAFEKAILADQVDPLPRLGLGLTYIRQGRLEEGRQEIEIATSLDPSNSLIRSYLGKAYYEEYRNRLAASQFELAKKLDSKDPTPWYYEAILKQSENRPVEALQDLQESIELNDNRVVYRSRLLLDQDLAARSASLGRIYTQIGFEQRALVEGWSSVAAEPADHSGHRLLADLYSSLPRHQIARVSELLRSQLLQPLNQNPLQPQLAESRLGILDGSGPSTSSLNEFNPLFSQDGLTFQGDGILGSNSTFGDDLVVSGLYGPVSFSLGQFHFETDGFRENNDQKNDIYSAFIQASLSPETNVQAEYRHSREDRGDRELRFSDIVFNEERHSRDVDSLRFGLYHRFTPGSEFIASLIRQKGNARVSDEEFNFSIDTDFDGYTAEIQHIWQTDRCNLISGIGYFDADRKENIVFFSTANFDEDNIRNTNAYLYSHTRMLSQARLTLGASVDHLRGAIRDRNQFNPKLGLTWDIAPRTRLRMAVFRVMKRPLLADQSIEPMQVAGFNQYFDDGEATDAWRYGIGLDSRICATCYSGIELSKRDLKVPHVALSSPVSPPTVQEADWEEKNARAYFYWTPESWLAVSTEYSYERFDRAEMINGGIHEVDTHALPFTLSLFYPFGLSSALRATYYDQSGVFGHSQPVTGSDRFWLTDASLDYRFPKRRGLARIGVKNLFDTNFRFQDTDPLNPRIQPERFVFAKFTISFE